MSNQPKHTLTRRTLLLAAGGGGFMSAIDLPPWSDVAQFLESEEKAGTIPGSALVVSKNRKVVHSRYAGTYYSLGSRETPLHKGVRHLFYSYSKLVSSTVVVMAKDKGLIDYDAPVRTYIPEFQGGGKDGITLRHLLTHSAGIPNAPIIGVTTEAEWKEMLHTLCNLKTEWEPGSRSAYHAITGLFLCAEVVRRVSGGKPWSQICKEWLFDKIGAKTLSFNLPSEDAPVALTPQPKETPTSLKTTFGWVAGHPAGGCFGTAEDALKVLHLHLNRGISGGRRLISEKAMEEMHTVQYASQIESAVAQGKAPTHETWGLGILLRGKGAKNGGHDWFGFGDQTSPEVFGHAGIDTVIGVANYKTGNALVFISTNSPAPEAKVVPLRNGVTNRVFAALDTFR